MEAGPFLEYIKDFSLAFIPLFVAMDPVGILPIYMAMTRTMEKGERRKVLFYSLVTASAITIVFLALGKAVFFALGITTADFQIAGGLILLAIAISDIVQTARGHVEVVPSAEIGIVPIGTPIIAGPAAITTLIMQNDLFGFAVTAAALGANLLLIGVVFSQAETIVKVLGESGARGVSKVVALLLAAIAVMMIRRGFETILS